ncbi:hypothetical protein C8Q76DRAFT_840432 [Earliella scabrosa]|nr:hypothetical protein C8Q76DRAFT_840432 [Earliella scabrosa]
MSGSTHRFCRTLLEDHVTRCSNRLAVNRCVCLVHSTACDVSYGEYKDAAALADALRISAQLKRSDIRMLSREEVEFRIKDVGAYAEALELEKRLREEHAWRFMETPDDGHRTRIRKIHGQLKHSQELLENLHARQRHWAQNHLGPPRGQAAPVPQLLEHLPSQLATSTSLPLRPRIDGKAGDIAKGSKSNHASQEPEPRSSTVRAMSRRRRRRQPKDVKVSRSYPKQSPS